MGRNGVRRITSKTVVPSAKLFGIVQQTKAYQDAVAELTEGREITVTVPSSLKEALAAPTMAFLAALRRWNIRNGSKFKIYAREGRIYAVNAEVPK